MSAMTLITHVVNPSTTSPLTLTGIPDTYDDLLLIVTTRVFRDGQRGFSYVQFNADTTAANYREQRLRIDYGYGISAQSTTNNNNAIRNTYAIYNSTTGSMFSANEIYISDYTSANPKVMSAYGVANSGTDGQAQISSSSYAGTSAISSLRFYDGNGNSYIANSTITLYGITKAA